MTLYAPLFKLQKLVWNTFYTKLYCCQDSVSQCIHLATFPWYQQACILIGSQIICVEFSSYANIMSTTVEQNLNPTRHCLSHCPNSHICRMIIKINMEREDCITTLHGRYRFPNLKGRFTSTSIGQVIYIFFKLHYRLMRDRWRRLAIHSLSHQISVRYQTEHVRLTNFTKSYCLLLSYRGLGTKEIGSRITVVGSIGSEPKSKTMFLLMGCYTKLLFCGIRDLELPKLRDQGSNRRYAWWRNTPRKAVW